MRLKLAIDAFPCEDAHAQERTLLPSVLETVETLDLWIGDRNFCTTDFLVGIDRRQACFVIRQHAGSPRIDLIGKRRAAGRSETGLVYEQSAQVLAADGSVLMTLRRITVELQQPTRDEENEIHLLTNLPRKKALALVVAELYRQRWTIELNLRSLKIVLQMDQLRCQTPHRVRNEFYMHLVAYNLIRRLIAVSAQAAGGEPWTISFKGTLQTIGSLLPLVHTRLTTADWCTALLDAIATHNVGDRPNRFEPRVRKRRPKKYKLMREPRENYRKRMAA